jgi:hypothetical protein
MTAWKKALIYWLITGMFLSNVINIFEEKPESFTLSFSDKVLFLIKNKYVMFMLVIEYLNKPTAMSDVAVCITSRFNSDGI